MLQEDFEPKIVVKQVLKHINENDFLLELLVPKLKEGATTILTQR